MKLTLAHAALVALAGALAACGDGRPRAPVSDGERLYLARCTACHAAYDPRERTADEWAAAVAKMERWKKVSLSNDERALILSYLDGTEPKLPAPVAGPASRPPPG